jgi:hypothetical protein
VKNRFQNLPFKFNLQRYNVVGPGKSSWILASPAQLRILVNAKTQLAGVLRAQHRPKLAFDEAAAAARALEALGGGGHAGTPGGGVPATASGFTPGGMRAVGLCTLNHVDP